LIGIDGERLSPQRDERRGAQTAVQARKDLAMGLQFKVEAVAQRDGDPEQQNRLPGIPGR
jgi:hypothetical protein